MFRGAAAGTGTVVGDLRLGLRPPSLSSVASSLKHLFIIPCDIAFVLQRQALFLF